MNIVELIIAGAAIELESRARRSRWCMPEKEPISITTLLACWHVADIGRGWQ